MQNFTKSRARIPWFFFPIFGKFRKNVNKHICILIYTPTFEIFLHKSCNFATDHLSAFACRTPRPFQCICMSNAQTISVYLHVERTDHLSASACRMHRTFKCTCMSDAQTMRKLSKLKFLTDYQHFFLSDSFFLSNEQYFFYEIHRVAQNPDRKIHLIHSFKMFNTVQLWSQ